MSHVSLGRPKFVPGTHPGHPTAKFLYVIFLCRFFSLHNQKSFRDPNPYWSWRKYCNTPPTCTAVRSPFVSLYLPGFWALKKGKSNSTPPICTARLLPFVRHTFISTSLSISRSPLKISKRNLKHHEATAPLLWHPYHYHQVTLVAERDMDSLRGSICFLWVHFGVLRKGNIRERFFWPKFSWPKFFWSKFFWPKLFWPKFFWPRFFWPKCFWTPLLAFSRSWPKFLNLDLCSNDPVSVPKSSSLGFFPFLKHCKLDGGNPKYPPFWGSILFKRLPRQFQSPERR